MIQKNEMRETITHVASELFARYGYQKTTMDDIARACGKGKSSIYYYFRNKEEAFIAVLEQDIIMLKAKLLASISSTSDPKDKLKRYVITRMNGMKSLINIYNVIKNEYLSQFAFIEQIRERYDNEEHDIIKGILDEGIKGGIFEIEDTSIAALALVTAMKGFEIPLFIKRRPDVDLESRLDKLLSILFHGLLKR